jgi:hypothetical protein
VKKTVGFALLLGCCVSLIVTGRRPWAFFLVALAAVASCLTPLQMVAWSEAPPTLAVLA